MWKIRTPLKKLRDLFKPTSDEMPDIEFDTDELIFFIKFARRSGLENMHVFEIICKSCHSRLDRCWSLVRPVYKPCSKCNKIISKTRERSVVC